MKHVISLLFIVCYVYSDGYSYTEIKSGKYYKYKKEMSNVGIRDSKDRLKYIVICEALISFTKEDNIKTPQELRLKYSCYNDSRISDMKDNYNIEHNMSNIADAFSNIFQHYKLKKYLNHIKYIQVRTWTQGIKSAFLIKALNKEKGWSKKVYEIKSYKLYRDSVRKLLDKLQVYKPIESLFTSFGCSIQISENFSEHLWYQSKPELISKDRVIKKGLIKKELISKSKYPNIEWVDFDITCK